jgi:hypothetical protein
MANDISALLRTWLVGGFSANRVLRNSCNLFRAAGKTFDKQPGIKGSTVKVPIPVTKTVSAVTPAMTPPTPGDNTPTSKEIALDQWFYSDLNLTDKEVSQINAGEFFIPSGVDACLVAILESVNAFLHGKTHGATGYFGYVGTAGTNPFASNSDILADAWPQAPHHLHRRRESREEAGRVPRRVAGGQRHGAQVRHVAPRQRL